ncbi:MAG: 23S rRNA (uracil(1939)-C(5))-methyltransferase RlmD [Bacteroidales bacterium]|nr:23S rRNA (uracil(1939)-C(5))-methyltransferase RlmD [Bacteroidales bacterium]MDZ4203734.1 23S rRNA (uracil(1939)-C(5))-methyltransferase RlmD [Bacteroidales bacterium]
MAKKIFPIYEKIEITDAGAEGKGIARVDDLVIFVPYTAPGDIVDVKIIKKKKSFLEGRVHNLHRTSSMRIEPFCSHFGLCGGCTWQHVNYEHQLDFKKKQVENAFKRIGKFEFPPLLPVIASPSSTYYRNKLEYTFSNRRWLTDPEHIVDSERDMYGLGFHLPGLFDRILDIETCYLQPEPSNSIRLETKKFALENNITFYDHRRRTGFLRNLLIRNSNTGEVMVILVVNTNKPEKAMHILSHLGDKFPAITNLFYIINSKLNDSISDLEPVLFAGKPYLTEEMEGLRFRVGPLSFYQTNSQQAYQLYTTARDFAELKGNERVYDLYTGAGTIANFVAARANRVIGIEYVEAAVKDAVVNSQCNNIQNTEFYYGDILSVIDDDFVATHGHPDVIITDPPRAGMHEGVINKIASIAPEKIVYVSCNPATQARDISLLTHIYSVEKVQPVDMFPHTNHIENVALLRRK